MTEGRPDSQSCGNPSRGLWIHSHARCSHLVHCTQKMGSCTSNASGLDTRTYKSLTRILLSGILSALPVPMWCFGCFGRFATVSVFVPVLLCTNGGRGGADRDAPRGSGHLHERQNTPRSTPVHGHRTWFKCSMISTSRAAVVAVRPSGCTCASFCRRTARQPSALDTWV